MTYVNFTLDKHLEELAAGVVGRMGFDPPEVEARLQPPQLSVRKGPPGVNSQSIRRSDGTNWIVVGADLYRFCHQYTRAAATYFLPGRIGGARPSGFWPRARSAVATTLDWISCPSSTPLFPWFNLTPRQLHVSHAFGDYAYRFALCHEMAHVALNHMDPMSTGLLGAEDIELLRTSQEQELAADEFGLDLQIKSLPDSTQLVTGVTSAVYYFHMTGLLDMRLMLLGNLVDYRKWQPARTHPSTLTRVTFLIRAAARMLGGDWERGLSTVHESLTTIDSKLYEAAIKHQEDVAAKTLRLVRHEAVRQRKPPRDKHRSRRAPRDELHVGNLPTGLTQTFLRLFDRSPLGVLRALEPRPAQVRKGLGAGDEKLRSLVSNQLASALPDEVQSFRGLSKQERAKKMA